MAIKKLEKGSFGSYVAETKQEYKYVLKFAVNDMSDQMIDMLESCLKKYDLKSASAFRKTPIQESPLDFPNIKNSPVYICDLTLGYPGSLEFLQIYLCNSMGISPQQLAIYSENDPRQIETDLYLDRTSPEYKAQYKARLGSDYEEEEAPAYGEKYNISFLKELEKVSKERPDSRVFNALSPKETIDHSTLTDGYDEFNSAKNLKKDDLGLFGRVKKTNLMKVGVL